jgi:uncharacterized protein
MAQGSGEWGVELGRLVPFRLAGGTTRGTRFVTRVAIGPTRYSYEIAVEQPRIIRERLDYTPPAPRRQRLLFERQWDGHRETWRNGEAFAGEHTRLQAIVRHHEPFLALLVQRFEVEVLRPLVTWLKRRWLGVGLGSEQEHDDALALQLVQDSPSILASVTQLLRQLDTGIGEIVIERDPLLPDGGRKGLRRLLAVREAAGALVAWPFTEESSGTQRLFSVVSKIIAALEYGTPVLIDELGGSIHPHIAHELVRLFQNRRTNANRAQLIFSSHDATLLGDKHLRPDQVWFTRKRSDGSTELYTLGDYKGLANLLIDRAYLDGRFDAVPILPAEWELLPTDEPSPA